MASNAKDINDGGGEVVNKDTTTATPASAPSSSQTSAVPTVRYKYKYPEAFPTPNGEEDEAWNKLYTAADSRMYNKHGKSANESRKYRQNGETYELALRMLQEKKEKLAAQATGGSVTSSSKASTPKTTAKKTIIKKEPSTSSRDATPFTDKMSSMSISEKIKSGGRARKASSAAPSDPDAPGSSTAPAVMGSPAPPGPKVEKPKKKGTAAPVRKSGPKSKSEDNAYNPSRSSMAPTSKTGPSSEDESNDGGEYCICRGPDDHRMMVFCEGPCKDWYHCSCVKIDETQAKELLDRYYCPNCQTPTRFTTWKRYCRYGNVGDALKDPNKCRKAARVSDNPPSKYCSDEHRDAFFKWVMENLTRKGDEPSRGGRLSRNEVGWILKQITTLEDLRALGKKPKLPVKEGADPNRALGLDFLSKDDADLLEKILTRQDEIDLEVVIYKNKEKLRGMVVARAETAAKHLGVKVKEICGYDGRLALNQIEFVEWSKTEEGKRALKTGVLGPRTAETKGIGAQVPMDSQDDAEVSGVPELKGICLKKKCLKHKEWATSYRDDAAFAYNLLSMEKKKLAAKKDGIIGEAETTEAMRPEYADNVTIQCF